MIEMLYLVDNKEKMYQMFDENKFSFYDYDENYNQKIISNMEDLKKLIKKYNENMDSDYEILDNIKDKKNYKGSEALEQVDQRGGGCPIPGDIQGQCTEHLISCRYPCSLQGSWTR